jgi:cell division protein FtsZ
MAFEFIEAQSQEAVIKVFGVGGCGGNAVDHMIDKGVKGVEFIAGNTDVQALRRNQAKIQLQLGSDITKGLGAGADPEVGRAAALEDRDRIAELIRGADMLFLTAGMGGGTGTGAAPVVAQVAKELGILTVAVVTKPFAFEGKRQKLAQEGLDQLSEHVDSLIVIPNDKLMHVLGEDITVDDAFRAANDVLHGAVAGTSVASSLFTNALVQNSNALAAPSLSPAFNLRSAVERFQLSSPILKISETSASCSFWLSGARTVSPISCSIGFTSSFRSRSASPSVTLMPWRAEPVWP